MPAATVTIPADLTNTEAIRNAVRVLSKAMQWDSYSALELAGYLLEDVNAHEEASAVRKMLEA